MASMRHQRLREALQSVQENIARDQSLEKAKEFRRKRADVWPVQGDIINVLRPLGLRVRDDGILQTSEHVEGDDIIGTIEPSNRLIIVERLSAQQFNAALLSSFYLRGLDCVQFLVHRNHFDATAVYNLKERKR